MDGCTRPSGVENGLHGWPVSHSLSHLFLSLPPFSRGEVLFIHHFSASFCCDSFVFDAQKFEIVIFHGHIVTDDKSAFAPRTDGVCPMYRWRLYMERSATFLGANGICVGSVVLCLCFARRIMSFSSKIQTIRVH